VKPSTFRTSHLAHMATDPHWRTACNRTVTTLDPNEQKVGTRYKPETVVTAKCSAIPSYVSLKEQTTMT
jgi:hypothetical protein